MNKIPLTVQILTRNSSRGLEKLLPRLERFGEILIVDGNSTDGTLNLAVDYNCRIIKQEDTKEKNVTIKDFSKVRNRGIRAARYDWQLVIDSDEYIDDKLVNEVEQIVSDNIINIVYNIPRKFVDNKGVIDICMGYPNRQIRLFNRLSGTHYTKPVHEKLVFDKNKVNIKNIKNFIYVPLDDYHIMRSKGDKYLKMAISNASQINFYRWLRWYVYFHTRASVSYLFRLFFSFFKKGHHMPLRYELYIFYYNWRMISLSFKKMLDGFINKKR